MEPRNIFSFSTFEITGEQLCEAGRLVGYSHLLLPLDPYRGRLIDEIDSLQAQALERLKADGWLEPLEDNSFEVEEILLQAVSALALPERSIFLKRAQPEGKERFWALHRKNSSWILLADEQAGSYSFTILTQPVELLEVCRLGLGITGKPASPGAEINLAMGEFEQAGEIARRDGVDACRDYLLQHRIEEPTTRSLSDALANSSGSASLTVVGWNGQNAVSGTGFSLLEGEQGLWKITPDENQPDRVVLSPCTADKLQKVILSLIETASR